MRWLVLASLVSAVGCSQAAPPAPTADEVRAAIEAQNRAFGDAVRAGDSAAIGELYASDAAVLPPNAAKVTGRAAIADFWGAALAGGLAGVVLTTEEVAYAGGDVATEIGSAVLSAKDGSVVDEGKYIVLWRRDGNTWRLQRDIWNSNRALAPAAPSEPATDAAPAAETPEAKPH
jgi:uncharacterized protein (TIGR02246 family)